jgi:hypothetical protein
VKYEKFALGGGNGQGMTDQQMVTCAGMVGIMLLAEYELAMPEHKRNHRKVKAVNDAIIDLLHGSGHPVDDGAAEFLAANWNRAMFLSECVLDGEEPELSLEAIRSWWDGVKTKDIFMKPIAGRIEWLLQQLEQ